MSQLKIYTDGSSSPNTHRAGGWGLCVVRDGKIKHEASAGALDTTNNIMEMTGVLEAMNHILRHHHHPYFPRHVTIISDSKYVLNGLHGVDGPPAWYHGWIRRKWKTAAGAPVANKELWKEMINVKEVIGTCNIKLDFEWIRGHNNDEFNERADTLAVDAKHKIAEENGYV